jgi:hypothetical protein
MIDFSPIGFSPVSHLVGSGSSTVTGLSSSTPVSTTNLTTQANSAINADVLPSVLELGQQNPMFYVDLVKARSLHQNLPDGVDATYLDCKDFINLLDQMNILSSMTVPSG